ncbi:MAG: hypothetical protein ACW981_11825 [Candidatus Hodarchaeales archaeon]
MPKILDFDYWVQFWSGNGFSFAMVGITTCVALLLFGIFIYLFQSVDLVFLDFYRRQKKAKFSFMFRPKYYFVVFLIGSYLYITGMMVLTPLIHLSIILSLNVKTPPLYWILIAGLILYLPIVKLGGILYGKTGNIAYSKVESFIIFESKTLVLMVPPSGIKKLVVDKKRHRIT